ncbi:MAG: leucyl/phenylalanyl-tRNA--protein transferase [Verrucomicrobiales bacterium]|nr:leucyl/phenylalanyl-tRNA--protein transferase [Verrucomicrobiales bacterium]
MSLPFDSSLWQTLVLDLLPFDANTAIRGFLNGQFPQADDYGKIGWHAPAKRGVLPIENFHVSKNLRRLVNQDKFEVRIDTAFEEVIRNCSNRQETWLNESIIKVYRELNARGIAHSIEVWQAEKLVGGLYGVAFGGYFQGESQFSLISNGSKVALVQTLRLLKAHGFQLHDTQHISAHLEKFGGFEMQREEFNARLIEAVVNGASFPEPGLLDNTQLEW